MKTDSGIRFKRDICKLRKFNFTEGLMEYDRKKVKNALNIVDYQLSVLYGNGSVFATCVSRL